MVQTARRPVARDPAEKLAHRWMAVPEAVAPLEPATAEPAQMMWQMGCVANKLVVSPSTHIGVDAATVAAINRTAGKLAAFAGSPANWPHPDLTKEGRLAVLDTAATTMAVGEALARSMQNLEPICWPQTRQRT